MTLSKREQFFYDNAGWSEPPGREQCARELAAAEVAMDDRGWRAIVDEDPDGPWDDDCDSVGMVERGEAVCLEVILLSDDHKPCAHNVLGSLCNIIVSSADDPYIRVVTAELASEAL
jgi:hypothetical protein